MKINTISLRRRHLMMAAAAGAATPASAFTFLRGGPAMAPAIGAAGAPDRGEKLVVSGRIVDAKGKAVSNATLEAWHDGAHHTTVASDADGRLMFTTTTPAQREGISYRISRGNSGAREGRFQLYSASDANDAPLAHLHRDDAGVWRSTFALTLA
jgi:hypothetical protein